MKKTLFLLQLIIASLAYSQSPHPALVGYWHNWNDANAPYIQLNQIDSRYNIIEVSFATPAFGTHANMQFTPTGTSVNDFVNDIHQLQSNGRKVLISIGGASDPVTLSDTMDRNIFVSTMMDILNTYDFDGIDIDLEGSSLSVNGGSIANPTDAPIINLIDGVREIMRQYSLQHGKRLLLTMAPETAFVQGGMSAYGGIWGAYLPVITALKDSIEILQVQLYNSGSMFGLDNAVYTQGTADFIVAMTEATIQGFNTPVGSFYGMPAEHVAVALPACPAAAGGGYTSPAIVESAMNYLLGNGPRPGNYTLVQSGGYPDLRGMMTWSVNWDIVSTCGSANEFANTFENIFGTSAGTSELTENNFEFYPNPATTTLQIRSTNIGSGMNYFELYNLIGTKVQSGLFSNKSFVVDVTGLSKGIYFAKVNDQVQKVILQ